MTCMVDLRRENYGSRSFLLPLEKWIGNVFRLQGKKTGKSQEEQTMSTFACKAVIYNGLEDVYGPCGCGMDMAILPVLLPRHWLIEERPPEVEDHEFCKGFDFRRISGFSCNNVFEHEMDGVEYLANFSCCRECAERAVQCGYAVWAEKEYPMTLR